MEQNNGSMLQAVRKRNRVRELRENKLMTQAQLARKARVALRTIHSVEKGMNCRMDTKRKIRDFLSQPRSVYVPFQVVDSD